MLLTRSPNYNVQPAMDIDQETLELLSTAPSLVICSREQMCFRLKKVVSETVKVVGIWEEIPVIDKYSFVVLVGKDRVHPVYLHILDRVVRDASRTNNSVSP